MPGSRVSDRMRRLYQDVSGYGARGAGPDGRMLRSGTALVYGELTAVGIRQLVAAMQISASDHFVDLGSGVGKVVLQVALGVPGATCTGIEIDGGRYQSACEVLRRAEARGLLAPGRCTFRHGDVLSADLHGATALFANSTCFPRGLLNRLARRVATLPAGVAFGTLQALPPRIAALFQSQSQHACVASWSRHVTLFLYRR